ncbi:MAG: N-acetylmuramoyl-L-alanine amidase [Clostridium sp.]
MGFKFKNSISFILIFTFILNILGVLSPSINASANSLPKITSIRMVDKTPTINNNISLKISSKGSPSVQYSVYLYSPTKKVWENVSSGYTSAVAGNGTYTIKLKKPLHKGNNNLRIWVKKSYSKPSNKGGYDDFKNFSVNVNTNPPISQGLPIIKSANIPLAEQIAGEYPNMKLISNSNGKVQYSVHQYSPTKKVWENVSGGYCAPVKASSTMNLKLNKPLHNGENSFNIWVKRSNKPLTDKNAYDSLLNYKINVKSKVTIIPKITSVNVEASKVNLGGIPSITLKSDASIDVQYSIHLYSQSKGIWEDVSGGYSDPVTPNSSTSIKIKEPLKPGKNTLSIWVKRVGHTPIDKGGYDSYVSQVVDVSPNLSKGAKISNLSFNEDYTLVGSKPQITCTSTSGDNSNVSYKTFLYSNSKKQWIESSTFTDPRPSSEDVTIKLDTPLEDGTNKVLVWSKRSSVPGEVYEDYKTIEINSKRPSPLKKRIVIDPGHGGKDSGAISPTTGTKERDIALIVGIKLGDMLKSNGYEVLYTREDNYNVNWDSSDQNASLKYRYDFANSMGADMFIAVHCNSFNGIGYGTETLYSKKNPKKDEKLARSIQNEVIKITGMRDRGIKNGSNWQVVNNTKMPASLVELGFIDNLNDEPKLRDSDFQDKFATGIYKAISKYWTN